ncbi:MAG TPA: thiamine pyrophosphate-dependent enzyme [Quisquiliibacterium sp.]|nr:thiamine pyrophosphate-dependent enzyme [Quisquiliibacterium sp.]
MPTTTDAGQAGGLDRRETVRALLAERTDLLVVTGLGSSTYDVAAAGDHDLNFYLWGAMGGAAMIGLGLALAQPQRPVLVLTGDGEQLMGLGALATIGAQRPANLGIVVLDNGHYGETGMQRSHTAMGVDLVGVARACGFAWAEHVERADQIAGLRARIARREGLGFASVRIAANDPPRVLPSRDGVEIKNRFRRGLGFPTI